MSGVRSSAYNPFNFDPTAFEAPCAQSNQQILEHQTSIKGLWAKLHSYNHTNYVQLKKDIQASGVALNTLVENIGLQSTSKEKEAFIDSIAPLHTELEKLNEFLEHDPYSKRFAEQSKWIQAGFDPALVESDPDAVTFAINTKLIYTIKMFKMAGENLVDNDIDIQNRDGKAYFKVNGKWRSYEEIKDTITYLPEEEKFDNWTFIHPFGFVQSRDVLHPIAKVTPATYQGWLEQAQQLWQKIDEIDQGKRKDYILQIVSTGRNYVPEDAWWSKNLADHFFEHASARIITPEGNMYSFGTKMSKQDQDHIFSNIPFRILKTANTKVTSPDYEEPRNCDTKRTTPIPLTKERAKDIINHINNLNRGSGSRFNYGRQNCTRDMLEVIHKAGIPLNGKVFFPTVLYKALPNIEDIPIIGAIVRTIRQIWQIIAPIFEHIFGAFSYITPKPIHNAISTISTILSTIVHKILTIVINALFWVAGATQYLPRDEQDERSKEDTIDNDNRITSFSSFMKGFDIFNNETPYVYPSYTISHWQKEQANTLIEKNNETGFLITPRG